jgi:hypothetical protein
MSGTKLKKKRKRIFYGKKFIFEGPIHRKTLKKKIRMIFKFFWRASVSKTRGSFILGWDQGWSCMIAWAKPPCFTQFYFFKKTILL